MRRKGIVYILLSALFFSLMALTVKSVPHLPLSEKVFFRNFIGLIAISFTMVKNKVSFKIGNPKLMLLRSLFGLGGVGLYYAALERLALGDAVILNKLSPIFVIIFAIIFLKEPYHKGQVWVIVIGVIGALLIIKPSFDLSVVPAIYALLSAVSAGAAYAVIRRLTKYDKPTVIVFYFCLFSSVTMMPFMMLEGFVVPNFNEFLGLLGIGVFALTAQLFMTNAYKYAPASELSIYNYVEIIFSLLFGFVIWSERPDVVSILGAVMIILAGMINFRLLRMEVK